MKFTEDIDKLIKETLTEEEAVFYQELEEQTMWQMVFGLFKGKNKWILVAMNMITLIFFGFFIFCLVQFFEASEAKELIKWASGAIIFLLGVSMLKIFAWMQMDKNALLREIKRLELLLLSLKRE
ncbi:DUF6768 family protein [Tenacibaculum jejuense]|uniref:Uncharacterized protein n=1 Tax=Tenacibaculum jejuense TaxID=584609 RepID=A0A238UD19_9FLAO|nr:DUF6768 family protein [Tenacibaculum jejuense]SNR16374.1 Probable transmembrane protein of unknown function; putative anti ECF-type sigma factor [Tenacibaculum jejuense]